MDFQTTVLSKTFFGLKITITFGLYMLFGVGYVDNSVGIFFGPCNIEISRDKPAPTS